MKMKLFKIKEGQLGMVEDTIPEIAENEILVRIHAVSLNYRDILVTQGIGQWKPTKDRIPVSDGAGEVIKVGKLTTNFRVGDRVTTLILPNWEQGTLTPEKLMGSLGGSERDGVLAEYVALPENSLMTFPNYLTFTEAATLPVAALTAWNAIVEQGTLKIGDTILLIGTGGVSLFALQLAQLAGYRTIITSSKDEKLKIAKSMGAHHTINYKTNPDWIDKVLQLTHGEGVDQVIDVVGGNHINESLKVIKSEGIISMIGVLDGIKGVVDSGAIMRKAARIQGVETGSTEMYKKMLQAFELHRIRPVIHKIFDFKNSLDAFAHLSSGGHFGKIVISFSK